MSTEADRRRYAQQLADNWADQGKVMRGGWEAFDYYFCKGMTEEQRATHRKAFFLGAEHLFSTVMMILGPEQEPTERDLQRMSLVSAELEAFKLELASVHKPAERSQ